ncbi:MAG: transcriptional repressor, partial [Pseudomonadota bacterium]
DGAHSPIFLVCRNCHLVTEAARGNAQALDRMAASAGFKVETTVMEAIGLCAACQDSAPDTGQP